MKQIVMIVASFLICTFGYGTVPQSTDCVEYACKEYQLTIPQTWKQLSDEETTAFINATSPTVRGWGLKDESGTQYMALAGVYKFENKGDTTVTEMWEETINTLRGISDEDDGAFNFLPFTLLHYGETALGKNTVKYCFLLIKEGGMDTACRIYFIPKGTVGYCLGFLSPVKYSHVMRDTFGQIASSFSLIGNEEAANVIENK